MNSEKSIKISIVGTGKLARALLSGLIEESGVPLESLCLTVRSEESKGKLESDFPGVRVSLSNNEAVENANIVLVGVKPYDLKEVLSGLSESLAPGTLLLSLAASMEVAEFSKSLNARSDLRIGRLMANTACATGSGLMAFDVPLKKSLTQDEIALFEGLGRVSFIEEKDFDAFTVMAASAPAYMLDWTKALFDSAQNLGLDKTVSRNIVLGLLTGTMAQLSREFDPEKLMAQIATPGGMTAEGLEVLKSSKLSSIVNKASKASFVKAKAWKS